MCRTGKADASVSGPNNMSGLWWVAGNLVRNLSAPRGRPAGVTHHPGAPKHQGRAGAVYPPQAL
jgi:hypothetical protein